MTTDTRPATPAPGDEESRSEAGALSETSPDQPTTEQPTTEQPTTEQPSPEESQAADGSASDRRRPPLALLLVGLLTLAMVAGVAYLALQLRDERRTETARSEAVAASRDAARVLFSYDHASLEEDFARGLSVTTGDFREQYARTTEDVVKDVATQYKAVVVAEVIESAVVSAAPDQVETLVFLNQATTSSQIQGRQVDQSRVRMRMVERDGEWLVAEVSAL